jgi:protein SCO1/2
MSGWRAAGVLAVLLGVAACGSSAHVSTSPRPQSLQGPTFNHPQTAPSFALRNYRGRMVRLSAYRGKAVLVTFVYTHCHDVCPIIVSDLHAALALLGPKAARVQVIGISVDPKGDTPGAVGTFLARHRMTDRMQYLIGSRATLTPVWRKWGINSSNPAADDTVSHTSVVFGISARGEVLTAYPANFTPAEIAHDVPILAAL